MAATVGKEREEAVVHPNARQGGKLLSRLLTRDSSAAAPSFRVYYGVSSAGAVPFLWESQPGTPKNAISDAAMPPLTPPPSYYAAGGTASAKNHAARKGKVAGGYKFRPSGILGSILMATRRRGRTTPSGSPTSSFSSASTSSSSSTSSTSSFRRTGGSSRLHSSSSSFSDDEETAMATCFRVRHESFRALKGCRVAVTVRSALASVGGGHGAAVQRV
ncbi:hypothetical protein CFC21_046121 [Triticum aestivum]|uniref:Uncharacterized protein n=4 Tax=Triticinae TaxID=1648030 RepID=A0A453E3N9_AEGTS|nr:extracellular glycosidase CRH11 [Aegilops tauschii subsp. strangulata]XP_044352959.1 extracellular glycosidase CRH11-like [Triticum aestivum]KAF7035205.1 hypothetical protein CFC21_046121 [Triticum aestivum]